MDLHIFVSDLTAPDLAELVARHADFCDATAPADSCHRLPLSDLAAPDVTVWEVRLGQKLVGMGALKALDAQNGEIKSMHSAAEARGRGVGRAMLATIIETALARGYEALWLETGSHPDFAPARALYAAHGFTETDPFGAYVPDPHSIFMTCALTNKETP